MATITKLELTQINTRLATENAALRQRVAELEGDIARITEVASAVNTMSRPRSTQPAWQVERAEAMAAAKAMAMATRMTVKA